MKANPRRAGSRASVKMIEIRILPEAGKLAYVSIDLIAISTKKRKTIAWGTAQNMPAAIKFIGKSLLPRK